MKITKNFQIFKNKGLEYTQKKQLRALMYWKYIGPVPNSLGIFIIFPHGQKWGRVEHRSHNGCKNCNSKIHFFSYKTVVWWFFGILTSMWMIARQLIMYMHFIDPFNSIFMHVYWEFLTSFFFNGKDFFGYAQLIHIKVG